MQHQWILSLLVIPAIIGCTINANEHNINPSAESIENNESAIEEIDFEKREEEKRMARIHELKDSAKWLQKESFKYTNIGQYDSVINIERRRTQTLHRMYDIQYGNYTESELMEEIERLQAEMKESGGIDVLHPKKMVDGIDKNDLIMHLLNMKMSK